MCLKISKNWSKCAHLGRDPDLGLWPATDTQSAKGCFAPLTPIRRKGASHHFFYFFENFRNFRKFCTFQKIFALDFLSLQRIARHNSGIYGCLMVRATPKNYSQSKRTCRKKDMMTFVPPFSCFVALSADRDFRCSRITL